MKQSNFLSNYNGYNVIIKKIGRGSSTSLIDLDNQEEEKIHGLDPIKSGYTVKGLKI
jgi:hypothetical protein